MPVGNYTKEKFEIHHQKNPRIYDKFCEYAKIAAEKYDTYSAKAIFHVIRWNTEIGENDSFFKISDGWISHYSRKFMEEYPQYDGFFRTTQRKDTYFDE